MSTIENVNEELQANLAGFESDDVKDMLYVHSCNMARPGRPQRTKLYYFDYHKGWHYLTSFGYCELLEYISKNPDQVRSFFQAEHERIGRSPTCGPIHTWKFLAEDAGVPVEASAELAS